MADRETPDTHPELPEHDPAHDIDGRLTWLWLIGCTVGVFITTFLLHIAYEEMRFAQHRENVELAPTVDRTELREQEQRNLSAGDERRSLEQALESYVQR